jgi:transcriptional regulator with XRE-family HTH domain
MAMTPLQRKAALRSTATLKEMTIGETARFLSVSYNHLTLVLAGERIPSAALKERLAAFLDIPVTELFETPPPRM